jgi:hypothetical protein
MPLRLPHVVALLGLALPFGACAELDRLGSERMREVPTAQLCEWRGNPISGGQMRRELARRGEPCGDTQPALAAAPELPAPMPAAPMLAPPVPAAPVPAAPEPLPQEPLPVQQEAAEPPVPQPDLAAPLVTPACAERDLRRGGEAGGDATQRAVRFTNRCAFPIRVLYAADRSKLLSRSTDLLQPGEQTGFARIEDALDLPGYVVCSYARTPASAPCRVGPERR